jgi:hypothetical protein
MADLFNLTQTRSWIASWRDEYRGRAGTAQVKRFASHVERVAVEQRANFESATSGGRAPHWCKPAEYQKCVELLEATAKRARRGLWPGD